MPAWDLWVQLLTTPLRFLHGVLRSLVIQLPNPIPAGALSQLKATVLAAAALLPASFAAPGLPPAAGGAPAAPEARCWDWQLPLGAGSQVRWGCPEGYPTSSVTFISCVCQQRLVGALFVCIS
jgi:hypothetical protein